MKFQFILLSLICAVVSLAQTIAPAAKKMPVIIPENPSFIQEFAANELQYHLQLVFGYQPEIKKGSITSEKAFYLFPAPSDKTPLKPEEARWLIADDGRIFLYGEDNPVRGDRNIYRDLMVRITGYSAVFVDMSKNAQDEIIRRDELS